MKFNLVLLISVSLLLGCTDGGDENHLPTVSDNDNSTCGELLELASQYETLKIKGFNEQLEIYRDGDKQLSEYYIDSSSKFKKISDIINSALRMHDAKYTGDTAIEKYYRNYLRKSYTTYITKSTLASCVVNPEKDLNLILTEQLNGLYAKLLKIPRAITCKNYGENLFSYDAIVGEKDTLLLNMSSDRNFNKAQLIKDINTSCAQKPDEIASVVINYVTFATAKKLTEQSEKERREAQLEQSKREYNTRMLELSHSTANIEGVDCHRFIQQFDWATKPTQDWDNKPLDNAKEIEVYQSGLSETVKTISSHLTLSEHKKLAFDNLIVNDINTVAQSVYDACTYENKRHQDLETIPFELVESYIIKLKEIASAKNNIYQEIENEYSKEISSCEPEATCKKNIKLAQLSFILSAINKCEQGKVEESPSVCTQHPSEYSCTKLVCLDNKQEYLDYYIVPAKLFHEQAVLDELIERLNSNEIKMSIETTVEQCAKEATMKKLMDADYQNYITETCQPRANSQIIAPLEKDIAAKKSIISELEMKISKSI
ncbi:MULTISPECIES: hypothetical protein [Aeromonas]|nr:hypothetical protein [Aeromonas salmonicida]